MSSTTRRAPEAELGVERVGELAQRAAALVAVEADVAAGGVLVCDHGSCRLPGCPSRAPRLRRRRGGRLGSRPASAAAERASQDRRGAGVERERRGARSGAGRLRAPRARDRDDVRRQLEQPGERDLGRRRAERLRRSRPAGRGGRARRRGAARRAASARSRAIPSSSQRSTIPPRSARSSWTLSATWTAAIGASSSASSSCPRLTFESPTRATSPRRAAGRARAPRCATASADRARGSGTGRSAGRRAPRGSPRSRARIALARPSGTHAPPGRRHPALGHDPGARRGAAVAQRAGEQPLVVAESRRRGRTRARCRTRSRPPRPRPRSSRARAASSRSGSVERRMQPRPMRSSEVSSQPGRFRRRSVRDKRGLDFDPWGSRTLARPFRRQVREYVNALARRGARTGHRARWDPAVAGETIRAIVADAEAAERDGGWPGIRSTVSQRTSTCARCISVARA